MCRFLITPRIGPRLTASALSELLLHPGCRGLRSVTLQDCSSLTTTLVAALAKHSPGLKQVDLEGTNVGDEEVELLVQA